MKIYFIRHGETDWNKALKLQGSVDIPLNENGRHVARLTKDGLKNVKFDAVFSSPLSRAKETAEIILDGRGMNIQEDSRLVEINFGPYEAVYKYAVSENMTKFFEKPGEYVPEGNAESIENMYTRVGEFLNELINQKEYADKTILVATHGAALSGIIAVIKGYAPGELWKDGLHDNCGATVVEVKNGKVQILQQAVIFYEK